MRNKSIITEDDKRWMNKIWYQHYENYYGVEDGIYVFFGEVGSGEDRTVISLGSVRTREEMWQRSERLNAIKARHNPPLAINILNEIIRGT